MCFGQYILTWKYGQGFYCENKNLSEQKIIEWGSCQHGLRNQEFYVIITMLFILSFKVNCLILKCEFCVVKVRNLVNRV